MAPIRDAHGDVQFFAGVQLDVAAQQPQPASGEPPPHAAATPVQLLTAKGVVASLRVATRALAVHGLRRPAQFQRRPSQQE